MQDKTIGYIGMATAVAGIFAASYLGGLFPGAGPDESARAATPAATPEVAAGMSPGDSADQPADGLPLRSVWLVDAANVRGVPLVRDFETSAWSTGFDTAGQRVYAVQNGGEAVEFSLDGTELRRGEPATLCDAAGAASPGFFERQFCEASSWCLQRVEGASVAGQAPTYAYWAENAGSGERFLLRDALSDCQGCGFKFEATFSPSGRYVVFAERGGKQEVFLSDLEARTTRPLTHGNELALAPQWSPAADQLLYHAASGATVVEDVAAASAGNVGLPWPARFDTSGDYVFATHAGQTAVWDLVNGGLVGEPSGQASSSTMPAVAGTSSGFVAALAKAEGCDGIAIYDVTSQVACVNGGVTAVVSRDGSRVSVVRVTAATEVSEVPGAGQLEMPVYEVVVVEPATGSSSVALEAASIDPPLLTWNATSSHLLVSSSPVIAAP